MAALLMAISVLACSQKASHHRQGDEAMSESSIEAVLKKHTDELMAMSGVVGTAQGLCDDKPCIKVYVVALTPELEQKIPKNLEGYTVDIEVTGEFRALPKR
ncbi:hypothetical protein L0337_46355 [candidate division KSB1 bacterium]|nr:hypothetical protein [candidate division KSB1 bacterium]